MPESMLKANFVKENETLYKVRYTEYSPGSVMGYIRLTPEELRQAFGHIPDKIQVTVVEISGL
jgi:hypothetical protein